LSSDRLAGILSILIGIFALSSFFIFDKSKLVLYQSDIFLVRYSAAIFIANAGVEFIVLGVLLYKQFLVPYLSKSATRYERAKNEICTILLSIPIWISTSAYVFLECERGVLKAAWSVLMIYVLWVLVSGLRILGKGSPPSIKNSAT
jgi:hypothetical protein